MSVCLWWKVRKKRRKNDGDLDNVESGPQLSLPSKPKTKEDVNLDSVSELTEGASKLNHITKDRARRAKNVRPMTRQSTQPNVVSDDSQNLKVDENVEEFFTAKPQPAVNSKKEDIKSPSAKSTPEPKKKSKGLFRFGSKEKDKENEGSKRPLFPKILSSKSASPKKRQVSDVVEEADDSAKNNNNASPGGSTDTSSQKADDDRKSDDILQDKVEGASDTDSLKASLEKKLKTDSLGRTSNKSYGSDKKSDKSDSLDRKSNKSENTDTQSNKSDSLDRKSEVSSAESDSKEQNEPKDEEESQSKESENKETTSKEEETTSKEEDPDKVKELESSTEKVALRPPASKRSFGKTDKEKPTENGVEEKKDDEAEVKKETPEEKEEAEKKEESKEEEEESVQTRPKKPVVPGGIGMGFNIDLKALQEKRRSMMPAKPAAPGEKPSKKVPSSEENKPLFGLGNLKPVSKTRHSADSELDSKESAKPLKPADNRRGEITKSADSPLSEKKPVIQGSPKGGDSSRAENNVAEQKTEEEGSSEKPPVIPRPAGVNKPPPPARPRPGNRPVPAPRRSLTTPDDPDEPVAENPTQEKPTTEKPMPEKQGDQSGVVYDSATLKLSVKDKITKFKQSKTEDDSVKGKPLSDPDSAKGKSLSGVGKTKVEDAEGKGVKSSGDVVDGLAKEKEGKDSNGENKTGDSDLGRVEENSVMTDSGIDVDTPRTSFKDAFSKFGGAGTGNKTGSLPRNAQTGDVKKDSPVSSRRPHSMLAVLENNPNLKKVSDTKPNLPEETHTEKTGDTSKDKDKKTSEEDVMFV